MYYNYISRICWGATSLPVFSHPSKHSFNNIPLKRNLIIKHKKTCQYPIISTGGPAEALSYYISVSDPTLNECRTQPLRSNFTFFFLISCVNVAFLFWFCTFLNITILLLIPYCNWICIRPEFSSSVLHKMFQKSFILLISLVSVLLTGSCHIMSA